ncbi:hypothetical protein SDC9_177390 [bioreactor metagenome]|uniref:Schlafen AlbA-2 domain-containing protein n=1 Tax=bioreactor metagenome TaxID=1076179 RepID=A0A645H260_9ZZZZ
MLDLNHIERCRENNRLEAKLATGGLPESIWETYSSFANTLGGVILLGVEELSDKTLRVQGLLNPEELAEEFWSMANNRRVVNRNILTRDQVRVSEVPGGKIIMIEVPRAARSQLPVYVGSDPFTGSYRRSGDGDYRCSRAEVAFLLKIRDS